MQNTKNFSDERDCKNCKHNVVQGIEGKWHTPYYGCESWECNFEPKEDDKDE